MAKIGVEKVGLKLKKAKVFGPIQVDFSVPYKADTSHTHDFASVIELEGSKKEIFQAFYYEETPDTKKGRAKWVAQRDATVPYSKKDQSGVIADTVEVSIDPKFCGTKTMALEAFMNRPTNQYPAKLLVYGKCEQKLLSTTWSKTRGGTALSNTLKFGDHVWLNAQLEGCNGNYLEVEIYHTEGGSDPLAVTYVSQCISGELNIRLRDTYGWRKHYGWIKNSIEKYYAKIKIKGSKNYIGDATKELEFKFEVSSRVIQTAETVRPFKLGKNEINIERYETCRFKKISFKDEGKTIELFEEGKLGLKGEKPKHFAISERIHFDVDKHHIRPDAKPILDKLAKFLKDSPYIPVELGAHCDIRKDDKYNLVLSKERAQSSVDYLVRKGVDKDRISAEGYGRSRLLIKGKNLSEEEHQQNRRVTIRFKLSGGDAKAIFYETIGPSAEAYKAKKKLVLQIKGLDSTAHCFKKGTSLEHTTEVSILNDNGVSTSVDGTNNINKFIYSRPNNFAIVPLNYILPHCVTPNIYKYHIHTCRYYIDKTKETIAVHVYPDVIWNFDFLLDFNSKLSVKWANLSQAKHKEMQSEMGKIRADKRWEQTGVEIACALKAKWNKIKKGEYEDSFNLTAKFENKIKKLYGIFSQLREVSKYITGQTKGRVVESANRLGIGKTLPFKVVMVPPSLCLGAEWQCARGIIDDKPAPNLGTEIKLYFIAKPLVRLEIVIDLLDLIVQSTVAATTGGAGNAAAKVLLAEVGKWLSDDDNPVNVKMYMELVLYGEIKADASLTHHTAAPNKGEVAIDSTVGIIFRAGIEVKAKLAVIIAEFYAEGQISVKGEGSMTFGHKLHYVGTSHGGTLNYQPKMLFDGITAEVVIKSKIGMTIRKAWFNYEREKELKDYEFKRDLFPPFDILEEIWDDKVSIPIIKM